MAFAGKAKKEKSPAEAQSFFVALELNFLFLTDLHSTIERSLILQ